MWILIVLINYLHNIFGLFIFICVNVFVSYLLTFSLCLINQADKQSSWLNSVHANLIILHKGVVWGTLKTILNWYVCEKKDRKEMRIKIRLIVGQDEMCMISLWVQVERSIWANLWNSLNDVESICDALLQSDILIGNTHLIDFFRI